LLSTGAAEAASGGIPSGLVPLQARHDPWLVDWMATGNHNTSVVTQPFQISGVREQEDAAPAPVKPSEQSSPDNPPEPPKKRIFGLLPNNRTAPSLKNYKPLTAGEKFKIAWQDCVDRGTFMLAAAFGAEGLLTDANPSFGSGVSGYLRYSGASYADWADGNLMTEAVYPTIVHEDPRYFRQGEGSKWSRLGYAMGQIFVTHTDSGKTQFNVSEVAGNATAVAISNIYYADDRVFSHDVSKLFVQMGVDMVGNVLKEFSPDLTRKLSRKRRSETP
jgi:hypothetical protein